MPRIKRVVIPDIPHHITQRGNDRQRVFFDEADHQLYLDLLSESAHTHGLSIWAYCLMPNHVHILGVPKHPFALAATFRRTHADYARYFNLKSRRSGHVWQSRYYSCPLEGTHLWNAMAYIERNPVRAAIVKKAEKFPWSSARARLGLTPSPSWLEQSDWKNEYTPEQWKSLLHLEPDENFAWQLRQASQQGRPLGSPEFVKQMEQATGRILHTQPVGRPKKLKPDGFQLLLEVAY